MPFQPPAPWRLFGRNPEKGNVVKVRISFKSAARSFDLLQNRFEGHDGHGLCIAGPVSSNPPAMRSWANFLWIPFISFHGIPFLSLGT